MSVPKSEHKVYMYTDDYNTVCTEVYLHQRIETGGNLFGLWTSSGSAVINVVLGPGQECKRNTTSFFQDIEYLKRVGRFVNEDYMLCHIGEWHSHHSLSLNKPSSGYEQTIRRNFPQGMSKFLVIIANILDGGDRIVLSPYFFTHGGTRYEKAELKVLETNSPYSNDVGIVKQIKLGAEQKGHQPNEGTSVEIRSHGGTSSRTNPRNTTSNHNRSTSPLYSQATQCSTQVNPSTSVSYSLLNPSRSCSNASGGHMEPMDTSDDNLYPCRDYNTRSVSPSSPPVASLLSQTDTNQNTNSLHPTNEYKKSSSIPANTTSSHQPSSQNAPKQNTGLKPSNVYKKNVSTPVNAKSASQVVASPSSQAAPDHKDDRQPSKPEIIIKQIHDELKKWFDDKPEAKFEFKSSKQAPGGSAIEIKFKHSDRFWMVRFSGDFPAKPAKLFCSLGESSLRHGECSNHEIVQPLTNHVNILLSIKKSCRSYCNVCKNISKESLNKSATPTAPPSGNVWREDIVKALRNELKLTLATPQTLTDQAQDDGSIEIKFNHNMRWWFITLPVEFPDKPAEVSVERIYAGARQSRSVKLFSATGSSKTQPLISDTLIISAITSECRCVGHCSKQK